ncbi:MAG TPA: class I SAM-dependent methyltransferase [Solirubrobacterales bacterium]|nr:class I SAM-dependent methyltransferase [Solirubrobacterales bacterium]
MTADGRPKTTLGHWDGTWSMPSRLRLPSSLWVSERNLRRVLRAHVRPGASVLEVGCAPGKTLAWVARALGARVAGIDYSERGIGFAAELFKAIGIRGDLRCEDMFATSFPPDAFDLVYSVGLVEHFDDPAPVIESHVRLTRPGGRTLVLVPNYGGVYGRLQRYFHPENLALHNLGIMNEAALRSLAPPTLVDDVGAFRAGRMSPWLLSFERRWPTSLSRPLQLALNAAGLVQPFDIRWLCPMVALSMRRMAKLAC